MREKDAAIIWRRQMLHAERLATESGEPLQVIYAGSPNDDAGPDFLGAVIAMGGGILRGDVEIHVRSSDWYAHRHHTDSAYNGVILHAVMVGETAAFTRLQSGGEAPVLNMSKYPAGGQEKQLSVLCRADDVQVAVILDELGYKRFEEKGAAFRREAAVSGAAQALYIGLMGALGYSRNKIPFQELARRLPLSLLEGQRAASVSDDEYLRRIRHLLFSASGLPLSEYCRAEAGIPHSVVVEPLPKQAWRLVRVRPGNSPAVRLTAMSHILLRCRRQGLAEWVLELVRHAPLSRECGQVLERWLMVSGTSGNSASGQAAILGAERAAEMAVNILLPFAHACGDSGDAVNISDKAAELYCIYPRLAVNSVERFMLARLKLNAKIVNSARRQQGLLHIYKNYCSLARCGECPFSPVSAPG